MTQRIAAAAGLIAAATVAAARPGAPGPARPDAGGPAVVSAPATPLPAPGRPPSPLPVARRALRWQLAAETGRRWALPAHTFTPKTARELTARPPARSPSRIRAKLVALREQTPAGGARRVLATVRRDRQAAHINLLVVCRPRCLVASVE